MTFDVGATGMADLLGFSLFFFLAFGLQLGSASDGASGAGWPGCASAGLLRRRRPPAVSHVPGQLLLNGGGSLQALTHVVFRHPTRQD
jgi:hypothetical protein